LKYKKDALPKTAIAKPFIIRLKIARNTNKKAKVHVPNIDNNASNVEIEEVKPFETVFARMEKRRMGLKKKTNSPNIKNKNMHVCKHDDDDDNDDDDDDEVGNDDDEVEVNEVDDIGNVVDDDDIVEDDVVDDTLKIIQPTPDMKPPTNNNLLQYNNCKLQLKEIQLITWHESLMYCGVTGMMVNSLEMIIKFSNEIVKVHGMEIPPRMTWMDGLEKGDPSNSSHCMHYGLKILFVLMCSPHASDKKTEIT